MFAYLGTYRFPLQLYKELFPLEGDLDDLAPREGVHSNVVLEHHDAYRRHAYEDVFASVVLKYTENY